VCGARRIAPIAPELEQSISVVARRLPKQGALERGNKE
jgi:hypothetical protein